jgi:hypothetical protein
MARYHVETLAASQRLISREQGQRGRIAAARVRRSISTSYYASFHFLLEECANRVVGTGPALLRRRRIIARVLAHKGMKVALGKVKGTKVDASVIDYFGAVAPPPFMRVMAEAFLRAQDQRLEADYDLNASLSELDARILIGSVKSAISLWQKTNGPKDRDFKNALCLLMVLQGKLRRDES